MARQPRLVLGLIAALIALAVIVGWLRFHHGERAAAPTGLAQAADPTLIERGRYLAVAANCASCHTRPGGAPFSGGVAFETGLGTLYSSNITADPVHGIGTWTAADLKRALHEGVAARGYRLFPAFPYPSFTKLTDEDTAALYAYLHKVDASAYEPPSNSFVFRLRWGMVLWDALFFRSGRFEPNTQQSAEWNRGAYLVDALGHCGACHTPRNAFLAEIQARAFQGGVIREHVDANRVRDWSAVNLTSSSSGLKEWSTADVIRYLHAGVSPRGGSFGPMNEVIQNSTSQLTAQDAQDMATYIKSLPAPAEQANATAPAAETAKAGEAIYHDRCAKCHGDSGRGGMFSGPPLFASAVVRAGNPASLINAILYGAAAPASVSLGAWESMKPYAEVLSDGEIAAVATYVRGAWNNRAARVDASAVARQR